MPPELGHADSNVTQEAGGVGVPVVPPLALNVATVSELQAGMVATEASAAATLSSRQAAYWATVAVQVAGGVTLHPRRV